MKLIVLVSCMHQNNHDIVSRMNIQTDAVVVNQCNKDGIEEFDIVNKQCKSCHIKFISTKERGLSKSRNKCIRNADGADVCLICDDDEILIDNYEKIILDAYRQHSKNIVNTFSLIRNDCNRKFPDKAMRIGLKECIKTTSHQISFNKHLVNKYGIWFDEKMGSGTGNGGGEENKFMLSCYKTKCPMNYQPMVIASVEPGKSEWFNGYDKKWIYNWGWSMRRALGTGLGICYIFYFVMTHKKSYGEHMGLFTALYLALKGFFDKR